MKYLNKGSLIAILIVAIASAFLIKKFRWDGESGEGWKSIIVNDGKGYYAYLPAVFIRHDLHWADTTIQGLVRTQDGWVNKYLIGESLLLSPFYGIAHIVHKITNSPGDEGYSEPFQKSISLASLFYLLWGLACLSLLLKNLGVADPFTAITILLIVFGTNLLHYAVMEQTMSHVYSFAMIAAFLYAAESYCRGRKSKFLALSLLFLTLVILLRPTNGIIVLLVPFFTGSFAEFKEALKGIFKKPAGLLLALTTPIFLCAVQMYAWHSQTGHWLIWSYPGEGFYFDNPHIPDVLFSFRKGLFIYTPIAFLSLGGLFYMFKKNKVQFFSAVLFLLACIYLISSWWNWYYCDSFGHRAFVDFYAVFAALLAVFIDSVKKNIAKALLLSVLFLCTCLNLFQSWQYYACIIHPFKMNRENYEYVFLRTADRYKNVIGGNDEAPPYTRKPMQLVHAAKNNFNSVHPGWQGTVTVCDPDKKNCYALYDKNEFSAASFDLPADSAVALAERIYLKASLEVYEPEHASSAGTEFVVDIRDKNEQPVYYYSFPLNELPITRPAKQWKEHIYNIDIPAAYNPRTDKLKIYIWNKNRGTFFIDNFTLDFYRIFP